MQENSEKCGWLTHNHWGLNNHWKIGVATVLSYVFFFRICVSSILFSWEGCFKWLQPWLENHHHPVLSWADILSTLDWLNWECSGKLGHQPFWWFQHVVISVLSWMLGDCYFQGWNPSEELKISWILWEVHVFPCGPHEKTSPAMENPEMTFFSKGGLGNAIAVSHIQLPGWFKAKRPDGKHGDRPKYGRLISQRFRRQVMKTFPWGCSRRNWGYNQYKIGDIHLKFAVSYLCFDGDRESGSKLLSSLILLNMIGDFPNRKSTACGIYIGICFLLYLLGFLTQIQVVVSRVCHAPGLVMPNDCYFFHGG